MFDFAPEERVPCRVIQFTQGERHDEDDTGALRARIQTQEAVRLVEGGQSQASMARTLGLVEQTLFNWVNASRQGLLMCQRRLKSDPLSPRNAA